MLQPKKTKFLKPHVVVYKGKANTCNKIEFGKYALISKDNWFIKANQLESLRLLLSKKLEKKGVFQFRIFPHMARTKKAEGVRCGSGKGMVEFYYSPVCNGTVILEIDGNISDDEAFKILRQCNYKLPVKTKILKKE